MRQPGAGPSGEVSFTDPLLEPLLADIHAGLVHLRRMAVEGRNPISINRERCDWEHEHLDQYRGNPITVAVVERGLPYSATGGRVVVNQGRTSEGAHFKGFVSFVSLQTMGKIMLNDGIYSNRKTHEAEFSRASVSDIFRLTALDADVVSLQSVVPRIVVGKWLEAPQLATS